MTTPVILVIDDSTTIRKMVDSHLSQEGYRVVLAPTGERGIELAREVKPDLILLDHQLPGTTGIEVCRKIISYPECRAIPFLVSSTLRKQAYAEYMDVPNVVDSLPKPFKPELLKMAVANALETSAMIVDSQTNGTAVPEVVGGVDQPALSGDFRWLGLREVIDFLNNGRKTGMLEVETARNRVCFFISDGRIQGVMSASFNVSRVADELPESLKELAPLLQFTMSTGSGTQVDGLVGLLDRKVLDPRMLRTLLRHQAAVLTRYCFLNNPVNFSFLPERPAPALLKTVPVDCCLLAILIDGAVHNAAGLEPAPEPDRAWVRNSLRGQNLDRTGLSARHAQLLSQIDTTPRTTSDLALRSGLPVEETRSVLEGLQLAEWIDTAAQGTAAPAGTAQSRSSAAGGSQPRLSSVTNAAASGVSGGRSLSTTPDSAIRTVIAFEQDPDTTITIRELFESQPQHWAGHVVRDELSFELLLKRKRPQVVLVAVSGTTELDLPPKLVRKSLLGGDWQLILVAPADDTIPVASSLASLPVLRRPFTMIDLSRKLSQKSHPENRPLTSPDHVPHTVVEHGQTLELAGAHS